MFFPEMTHTLLAETKIPVKPDDSDPEEEQENAEIKTGRYGNLWEDTNIEFDDMPESIW